MVDGAFVAEFSYMCAASSFVAAARRLPGRYIGPCRRVLSLGQPGRLQRGVMFSVTAASGVVFFLAGSGSMQAERGLRCMEFVAPLRGHRGGEAALRDGRLDKRATRWDQGEGS
jgi:hypothetical protein